MIRPIEISLYNLLRLKHGVAYGLVLLGAFLSAALSAAESPEPSLASQLQALGDVHGFAVKGLHWVDSEAAKEVEGDVPQVLKTLLDGYNHSMIFGADGAIDKILISGLHGSGVKPQTASRKALPPEEPDSSASKVKVSTDRYGDAHAVRAFLTGPEGARRWVWLVVDEQANSVVLPASMMKQLGFESEELLDEWAETAAGKSSGKRGTINVRVGEAAQHNIEVTFVQDGTLRNDKLLGRSFLDNYDYFMLDDMDNQLILVSE